MDILLFEKVTVDPQNYMLDPVIFYVNQVLLKELVNSVAVFCRFLKAIKYLKFLIKYVSNDFNFINCL